MEYETVIGLEVHAQLLTRSKMFCPCQADYQSAPPNAVVCPVCLGMPGVLPVINKKAVEFTIMTGLALNCTIPEHTKFDRKNYPYPDLMKGYQISQYDMPIARSGYLALAANGSQEKKIRINRVHLEEDVAKLLHREEPSGETYSLLDVNRSGVPLMEIVSEPDLRSPEEAREYLVKLHSILQYLGVSTGNMEEGSFRCDANISMRPMGHKELTSKVEVKNMNSFRSVYRALQFEIERQAQVLKEGGRIVQETRGWVDTRGVTVSQRTKEYAHDYRYFPEPDLPPLVIDRKWVQKIEASLPELPDARRERFVLQYRLPGYDAALLTASKATANFFEAAVASRPLEEDAKHARAKAISNWLLGEMARLLNVTGKEIADVPIQPAHLMELLDLVEAGTISTTMAKAIFEEMFNTGQPPGKIIEAKGMVQISDAQAVTPVVTQVIADNPQAVADYLKGKETALKFLIGQAMKVTKGKANPGLVASLLKEKLDEAKGT